MTQTLSALLARIVRRRGNAFRATLLIATLVLTACGPNLSSRSGGQGSTTAVAPATLRLVLTLENYPMEGMFFSGTSEGDAEMAYALHAGLTAYDSRENLVARVAERVPTTENGDWKVFPDGRMETTWRIRPGVTWHDGTPLTAEDYVFGMRALLDNDVPFPRRAHMNLISEVTAPDAQTLLIAWKSTHPLATEAGPYDIAAMPRHRLQESYERGDKQAFTNDAYFRDQFVGLGPYRLVRWEAGLLIDLVAFDQYFLGRPGIDRIMFQFYGDANGVMAALLSGEADMATMGGFKQRSLLTLRSEWEAKDRGTIIGVYKGVRNLRIQFKDPETPWAKDPRVRQALVHGLDRQTLVDAMTSGTSPVADTLPGPSEPVYELMVKQGFAPRPYDPKRAETLMLEAGWTLGADRTYRAPSGQAFAIEVQSQDKTDTIPETEAIAGLLKDSGFGGYSSFTSDTATNKNELIAQFTGLLNRTMSSGFPGGSHLRSQPLPSAENRWAGATNGNYRNPADDQIYDRYVGTLDATARMDLLAQMLKTEADVVGSIYLYYDLSQCIAAVPRTLTGPGQVPPSQLAHLWNVHEWAFRK